MSTKIDIYQKVTNRIIELLEKHQKLNYSCTWFNVKSAVFAVNGATGRVYTGINQLLLSYASMLEGYNNNKWLTFKQVSNLNGKVKKGSCSELVTYVTFIYLDEHGNNITKQVNRLIKEGKKLDYDKKIPILKEYRVFNIMQTEGLAEHLYKEDKNPLADLSETQRDQEAETIIKATGAKITHKTQNEAYYSPGVDVIYLPQVNQFKGTEELYKTTFHELGHWTGNTKRLNRDFSGKFGSKAYAKEELIAELCTAFVCNSLGYTSQIQNDAAYIQSWLKALNDDKKFIVSAASKAQKAADFIFAFNEKTGKEFATTNKDHKTVSNAR